MPKSNQNHIPKKQNIFKRDTKNFDRKNFVLDFLGIDWTECLELDKYDELLDKYLPLKKLSQKQFRQRYKPWISDYILEKYHLKINFWRGLQNAKTLWKKIFYTIFTKTSKITLQTLSAVGKRIL